MSRLLTATLWPLQASDVPTAFLRGNVGACRSSTQTLAQVSSEKWVHVFNAGECVANARTDCFAPALRLIAQPSLATSHSSGCAELVQECVSFRDGAFRPVGVADGVCFGDFALELGQPSGMLSSRALVEQNVCATRRYGQAQQLRDVNLAGEPSMAAKPCMPFASGSCATCPPNASCHSVPSRRNTSAGAAT